MTDATFAALLVSPLAQLRLAYYTTLLFVCQGVFEKFFNFFEVLFVPCHLKEMLAVSSFRPTLLLYHNVFLLSRGFSKVFKKLFRFAFRSPHRSESPSPMRSLKALPNSQTLGIFYCDFCRFFGSSSIIPHPSPFVNTFFESFFGFFEVFGEFSIFNATTRDGFLIYIPSISVWTSLHTLYRNPRSHLIAACRYSRISTTSS